jgi:hypothetical protein
MSCRARLRQLQGYVVGMALATGERIDECHLISIRGRCGRVWVYENGQDVFIPVETIRDCWEIVPRHAA